MSAQPAITNNDIAAALASLDSSSTPGAVLDAFLPKPVTVIGKKLLPLTAGHELALAYTKHPLASGGKWEDSDVLLALFLFSRPSREIFALIEDGCFEDAFLAFVDSIPPADIPQLGHDLVAHWMRNRRTALAMENEHATAAKKKTEDSAGGSAPFPKPAVSLVVCLIKWCTKFLWPRSSR